MGYSNVTGDLNVYSLSSTRDLTVRRDSILVGNLTVGGNATFQNLIASNLTVTNTFIITATNTSVTNALSINNAGTATALKVVQFEGGGGGHAYNVAEFWDFQTLAMCIDPRGNVAIHQAESPGYALSVSDGIVADNVTVTGNYTGSGFGLTNVPVTGLYGAVGSLQVQNTQTNVTSVGTLWTLNVTGISNLNGSILGSLATPVQSNITSVGLLSNLEVSNSISVSNIVATGNLTVLSQSNLVSANLITANVQSLNVVSSNVSILNVNSGANITQLSVSTLSNSVSSNILTANIVSANVVTGNVQVLNVSTGANITQLSVTTLANISSANLVTANVQSLNVVSSNISILNVNSGANITQLSVTTLANLISANLVTANIQSLNVVSSNTQTLDVSVGANITTLTVSTLANISSANLVTANVQSLNVVTSNTQTLNVSTGANITQLSVTSLANLASANLVTANVQTLNVVTSNTQTLNVSTGANITQLSVSTLANISSANLVTANVQSLNVVSSNISILNVNSGANITQLSVTSLANISSANLITSNIQSLNVVSSNIQTLNVSAGANVTYLTVSIQSNVVSANLVTANVGTANVTTMNLLNLNVTSTANFASANFASANIANIYTTNIVGFVGSQWVGTIGGPLYYATGNVGINTSTGLGSNLTVTGNIYASTNISTPVLNITSYANVSVLNVSTSANIVTANLITANIANIYTTNIVGFVGSQWTGTAGGPLYYATGNVGINTSTGLSSNLTVAGNIYATNAVSTTNLIATGTLTVSQGGTFNIPTAGQSAPQNFPETSATGYTVTTALGTYTISASSSTNPAWQVFDSSTSSYWLSTAAAGSYSASSPYAYTAAVYSTSTATNTYGGEWLQLQAPVKMGLTSVIVDCGPYNPAYGPGIYVILGNNSSGNTGWTLLATQTGFSNPQTTAIVGSANYNYIRIVITNSQAGSVNATGYFAFTNVTLTGTYLLPSSGPAIYSAGTVGIGTTTPGSTLQVQGNIYASANISTPILNVTSYANVTVLNVSTSANILTANILTANIANIFTTNIVGFVGSQWSGTTGGPLSYASGNVAIGSSTNPGANLTVTGNLFVSNSITTTNVIASGTITGTWNGVSQGTLLTLATNTATGTAFATSSDAPTLQAYHVPLQSFTQNAIQAVSSYTITAQGLIKFSSTGLYQLTMALVMDSPVVKVALGTNTSSAFLSSTSAYTYVYTISSAASPSDSITIPINVQDISKYYYLDVFCRSAVTSGTYYLTAGTTVTGSQNGTYIQIAPFGNYISSSVNAAAGILITTAGTTLSSPLAQATPLDSGSASNTYHVPMTTAAGWTQTGTSGIMSVSANGNLQFYQAGVYQIQVCLNATSQLLMQIGVGSSASDSSLPSTIGSYAYQYAPMYTQDPSTSVTIPLNVTDITKFYYLDATFGPSTTVALVSTSTFVAVTPLSSYIPNPMASASLVVSQVVTARSTSYTALSSDYYIGMSNGGTVTIPQGATLTRGKVYNIKDESGLAGTNAAYNIVIQMSGADKIDGQSNAYIQLGWTSVNLMWTGENNKWSFI